MFRACMEVIGRPGQLNLIEYYVLSTNGFMAMKLPWESMKYLRLSWDCVPILTHCIGRLVILSQIYYFMLGGWATAVFLDLWLRIERFRLFVVEASFSRER